jgi:acyl carrier protein
VTSTQDKVPILKRIIALCNELELLPGDAARWIHADLIETRLVDSMTLLQLEALVEHEFGVRIAREKFIHTGLTLHGLAQYLATAGQ